MDLSLQYAYMYSMRILGQRIQHKVGD
jgi:hypothetical protein